MILAPNHLLPLSGNKNKCICLLALVLLASACSPKLQPVLKPDNKPTITDKKSTVLPKADTEKPASIDKKETNKSSLPVITLLLPFNADKINLEQASKPTDFEPASLAIDYYQGFKLGIDSACADVGKGLELRVFDTKDDTNMLQKLLKSKQLQQSNLIVGPVYPQQQVFLQQAFQKEKVYIVSPLSPKQLQQGSAYSILMHAPLELHAQKLARFTALSKQAAKIIILTAADTDIDGYVRPFVNELLMQNDGVQIIEHHLKPDSLLAFQPLLDKNTSNLLLVAFSNKNLWESLLKTLHRLEQVREELPDGEAYISANQTPTLYKFNLLAHPDLGTFASTLNRDALQHFQTCFTASFFIRKKAPETARFLIKYRKKYQIDASEYAIKGFDAGLYFGKQLLKKQVIAPIGLFSHKALYTDFEFKQTAHGYVNESLQVLQVTRTGFLPQP